MGIMVPRQVWCHLCDSLVEMGIGVDILSAVNEKARGL
jgi:hypothetical protein